MTPLHYPEGCLLCDKTIELCGTAGAGALPSSGLDGKASWRRLHSGRQSVESFESRRGGGGVAQDTKNANVMGIGLVWPKVGCTRRE